MHCLMWENILLSEQKQLMEKLEQREKEKLTKFRKEVSSDSVCLCLSICLSVYLSVCLSVLCISLLLKIEKM